MNKKYDIFISYRRLDETGNISGRDQARLIAKQLEIEHYTPFFDYSEIKDNEFDKVIIPTIEKCKVFILVLTKDSLIRCKDADDWVRREIETAISSGCKIVNVSPDNAFNGWPASLPDSLEPIKTIQISDIHMGSLFEMSVKTMVEDRIVNVGDLKVSNKDTHLVRRIVKKLLRCIEITILFISILVFCYFCVLDLYIEDISNLAPYYDIILPTYSIYMIFTFIGYANPQFLWCETRKKVTLYFFVPFILLTIVGGNIAEEFENNQYKEFPSNSIYTDNSMSIELTKNMFCAIHGRPKQIIESSTTMEQTLVVKFDSIGRVIYKSQGKLVNEYIWRNDGKTIECKEYSEDKHVGSITIYVHELSESFYKYEYKGITTEVNLNTNGRVDKIKHYNQMTSVTYRLLYKNDGTTIPFKMICSSGNQNLEYLFLKTQIDDYGNVIVNTQSFLGQISTNTSDITYY